MDILTMRQHVLNEYPNESWKKRVMKMPNNQIQALYFSFISRESKIKDMRTELIKRSENFNKIKEIRNMNNGQIRKAYNNLERPDENGIIYHQVSLFD